MQVRSNQKNNNNMKTTKSICIENDHGEMSANIVLRTITIQKWKLINANDGK